MDIFYGVAKSVVFHPGMGTDTGCLLINYNSWEALPADIRDIVETVTPALIAEFSLKENLNFTTMIWAKAAKEYGFKVINWTEDEAKIVKNGSTSFLDQIAKTHPINAKNIEVYRQQQRELGKF